MGKTVRSIIAGVLLASAVVLFSVGVMAPHLPQAVARPILRNEITLENTTASSLSVKNHRGAVRIGVWSSEGIEVTAKLRVYSQKAMDSGSDLLKNATVLGELDGDTYVVASVVPAEGLTMRSDLEIKVPAGMAVRVENEDGLVRVGPGCGKVTVRGLNTDMLVYAAEGEVDLETVNGGILLPEMAHGGRVFTQNGSIFARIRNGELEAESGNGLVAVSILDSAVKSCGLTSTNGAITLALAPACRVEVEADTARGTIISELDADPPLDTLGQPRIWRGMVQGVAAPAEAAEAPCRVTLRTRNGNISIMEGDS